MIAAFVQDKVALERGLFDQEDTIPEELTLVRMGKIVRDKYPELDEADQEAVRQHAIAALNITQQAKAALERGDADPTANTAFVDGVRKYVTDVRELDIDLIDRINPFGEAYAILAKAMDPKSLEQIQAIIQGKKIALTLEEARMLAKRALDFKKERGRAPSLTAHDPWERKMAEGVAFLRRKTMEAKYG